MGPEDVYILTYVPEAGTVVMYDAFCFLDIRVGQGKPTPFEECIRYDHRFLLNSSQRVAKEPPTGDGSPQADGVP